MFLVDFTRNEATLFNLGEQVYQKGQSHIRMHLVSSCCTERDVYNIGSGENIIEDFLDRNMVGDYSFL